MPSLLPHDLCHGRSSSRWLPAGLDSLQCERGKLIQAQAYPDIKNRLWYYKERKLQSSPHQKHCWKLLKKRLANCIQPHIKSIICYEQLEFNRKDLFAGSQREELHPWQRSWGKRLGIRKGGIEPQESPWKFSSIYPQNQSLPTLLLCALTYTSDFMGGCPPPPSLSLKKS